jgi:hypothetical protein
MPKKVFWPVAMIAMGLIVLSSNLGLLPRDFWNLWPLILVVVGLGGLLTSDRDEWMHEVKKSSPKSKKAVSRKRR